MLDGHAGELILGFGCIVIGVGLVWMLVRSASDGIMNRQQDQSHKRS